MKPVNHPFSSWRTLAFVVLQWMALLAGTSQSSALTLAWDQNTEPDIEGYRVHYGTAPSNYKNTVETGGSTIVEIENLLPGTTYYIAVTAYNSLGLESLPSEEVTFTTPSDPLADNDNDGLPDVWESVHGLNPADGLTTHGATGDLDGDGISNLVEYAFDSDPQVPGTSRITAALARNPTDGLNYLVITFPKRPDNDRLTYNVLASTNLRDWSPPSVEEAAPPVPNPNGITVTVSVRILPAISASAEGKTFVRVGVSTATGVPLP
jgi:hypothetical protein